MGGSVRSAPVLRAGVLYVTSMAGNLHAIDVEKGRQNWQFQAADHIHSTPSLSGNKVLFGCDSGKVYAVDCDSGKPVWETARGRGSLDLAGRPRWRSFFRQRRFPRVCRGRRYRPQALDAGTGRPDLLNRLRRASTIFMSAAATARFTASMSHPAKRYGALQREMASTPRPRWPETRC